MNHNGSLELALELVRQARCAGADGVKFQTFRADRLASVRSPRAPYQGSGDQLRMLQALELSGKAFGILRDRALEEGLEFLSTPFDEESAVLLRDLGVGRFKVSSGDLTNTPLLRTIGSFGLPVILSTGMARDGEIAEALEALRGAGAGDLMLLHCITAYPAPPEDLQLLRMADLRERFGLPVGFSDHSLGAEAAPAARALGACLIEKHLTLDRSMSGPDHAASADPAGFAEMVRRVRLVEEMLGGPERTYSAQEMENRRAAHRSVAAARDIAAGAVLAREDLGILRPGTGIPPRHLEELVGRRASKAIPAGEPIQWDMVLP